MSDDVRTPPDDDSTIVDHVDDVDHDVDRWRTAFHAFVIIGMILAAVLGIREVIDEPIVRLSDVRSTRDEGTAPRAQVLARNHSATTTYCIEITFEAIDGDGLSLESVVAEPTTGGPSLRPGQSSNFAAVFENLTEIEIREDLDDFLAFVTDRTEC
ncbi:MAG TPA: hypothetical protein VNO51_23100 [Ilumatobacteraceae bacterium]|nr:hypothetical protein [Ilumatobacteraceae bacterium]